MKFENYKWWMYVKVVSIGLWIVCCSIPTTATITEEPGIVTVEDHNPISPLSPADPRILTFGFTDETLVQLGTKKLNKLLKSKGIVKDDATTIKQRRRTLLNRGYAASVRNKKDNEEKILNIECDRIRRSITRKRDQLQDYLAHIEKCSHLICKLEDQSRLEIPEEYFSSDSEPDNNEFSKNYTFE